MSMSDERLHGRLTRTQDSNHYSDGEGRDKGGGMEVATVTLVDYMLTRMPGEDVARKRVMLAVCDAWAKQQLFAREAQLVICRQTPQRSAHRALQFTGLGHSMPPSRWSLKMAVLP
ncbi:hypothetical protein H105_02210 [Trichophyton soudanense CBS 452.61]|uniref:Uncharacterized protein n=1 Tax=Trichophyton soudanense CBS 452.61 TaxID=1215331 RepID=A0A022Y0Z0_TRISD|nr:hypothetical protein H105_02210 [Trichophyton soudanense CBS 452.61]